jgi:transposase InsO family protein
MSFEALEESFSELGGSRQRLQVDNARVFIDNVSVTDLRWNKRFLSFCGFYGIDPSRSLPGHPWSRGKAENPFDYLENHFITNSSFERKLKTFQQEVNERVHATTKKKPSEIFSGEKEHLMGLPGNKHTGEYQRYIGFKKEFREVTTTV